MFNLKDLKRGYRDTPSEIPFVVIDQGGRVTMPSFTGGQGLLYRDTTGLSYVYPYPWTPDLDISMEDYNFRLSHGTIVQILYVDDTMAFTDYLIETDVVTPLSPSDMSRYDKYRRMIVHRHKKRKPSEPDTPTPTIQDVFDDYFNSKS